MTVRLFGSEFTFIEGKKQSIKNSDLKKNINPLIRIWQNIALVYSKQTAEVENRMDNTSIREREKKK